MSRPGLCVIGRTDFATGMGSLTYAACELLSRHFDVHLLPTRVVAVPGDLVWLPSGRAVPVVDSAEGFAAVLFLDVAWNGASDRGYDTVPRSGFRVIQIAYDSDALPPEWVELLNDRFDLVLFTSHHLEEVARRSGVVTATGTLPIALDLEKLLAARYQAPMAGRVRFGTLSAFHERKGLEVLVRAFLALYRDDPTVELVIHSNLAIGDAYQRVCALRDAAGATNITISHGELSVGEKTALLESFDVYVNCSGGEGYSIGPREALALGKVVAVTELGAHADFDDVPGVFHFAPVGHVPARYPEIDNRVFGRQVRLDEVGVMAGLRAAAEFTSTPYRAATVMHRRRCAANFSFTALSEHYRRVFDPDSVTARTKSESSAQFVHLDVEAQALARRHSGRHGARLTRGNKIVIPAHDGGFFSVFNAYMSHLTWRIRDDDVALVVPDWNVTRLLEHSNGQPLTSYCYSRPEDGNLWLKLFEPVFDLSEAEMNDAEFLQSDLVESPPQFNESKEPLLTFIHAYRLYRAPWFGRFRRQYAAALREHVHLRPNLRSEIDTALADFRDGRYLVSVHVKHPSHGVEQPDQRIARGHEYLDAVRGVLRQRGIDETSADWSVFVATDQDSVVALFADEFGDRVLRFDDVRRLDEQDDAIYHQLDPSEQLQEGHQLQHVLAADPSSWSWRLAWEVWRDAEVMASSNVLLHAVSNVATAASYLGPDAEMIYLDPK